MPNPAPPGAKPATRSLSAREKPSDLQKAKILESNAISKERLSLGTLIVWQAPGDGVVVGAPPMSGIRFRPLVAEELAERNERGTTSGDVTESSRLDFSYGNWRVEVYGSDLQWLAVALSRFEIEDLTVGEGELLSLEQVEGDKPCRWLISSLKIVDIRAEEAEEAALRRF